MKTDSSLVLWFFGHTEKFKIYTTEGEKIISSEVVLTNGSGHEAFAGLLSELQVDALIYGDLGCGHNYSGNNCH